MGREGDRREEWEGAVGQRGNGSGGDGSNISAYIQRVVPDNMILFRPLLQVYTFSHNNFTFHA